MIYIFKKPKEFTQSWATYMFSHSLRRWPNINLRLDHRLVLAGTGCLMACGAPRYGTSVLGLTNSNSSLIK